MPCTVKGGERTKSDCSAGALVLLEAESGVGVGLTQSFLNCVIPKRLLLYGKYR